MAFNPNDSVYEQTRGRTSGYDTESTGKGEIIGSANIKPLNARAIKELDVKDQPAGVNTTVFDNPAGQTSGRTSGYDASSVGDPTIIGGTQIAPLHPKDRVSSAGGPAGSSEVSVGGGQGSGRTSGHNASSVGDPSVIGGTQIAPLHAKDRVSGADDPPRGLTDAVYTGTAPRSESTAEASLVDGPSLADQVAGAAKQVLGQLTNDQALQEEGREQRSG